MATERGTGAASGRGTGTGSGKAESRSVGKPSRSTKVASASRRRNRPGPRQRLLAGATHLFTTEGIRVIGIDRILREADVAKASLYSLFGSKDNLVVAYLQELDANWRRDWHELADPRPNPEDRIIAFFDLCIKEEPKNNFRGSHFQNAAGEYPRPETESEERIRTAAMEHRRWCRDTMACLLTERFGYASRTLADQLMVFIDGGLAGTKMCRTTVPLETARDMARQLLLTAPMSYSI
ncbi:TetR/AcrR family transcriptional regulator [Corynebacterium heidelbergense]|uniref:TetR/AcrR family transcriptional regulator n=1 Tax=Corynebacterium heidelbergense TaxID=2055947 RepID=A0A364V9E7_9CORY|nr:TetR/AcrR family transcriptional regulator [Corynebacterium heidelbergense]RAV33282.1 TetR/AcrR family transcriptional regulator [Corynebacterium heidelbergense]WCZ35684.1 Transcriptional regulator, TetR family [Corynebacterium heidelbergense]